MESIETSLVPKPGEQVKFHPLRAYHKEPIVEYCVTVLDVRQKEGSRILVVGSCAIIKNGKARIVRSLTKASGGGDGDNH
jgi:hypothetical protein